MPVPTPSSRPTVAPDSIRLKGFPFWVLTLLMLVTVGGVSAWNTYAEYGHTLEQEYRLLEVRARHREARIAGALRSVDLMLGNLIEDLAERPAMPAVEQNDLLRKYLRQLPELRNLLVIDATGRIRAEARESAIGFDASQREYFIVHRAAPASNDFHISRPFKATSGLTATTLSRVIRDRRGQFSGIAVASIDSGFFSESLKFSGNDKSIHAALINRHGDILNVVPHSDLFGKSLEDDFAYATHRGSGQESTRHLGRSRVDAVKRLSVFQNLGNAPLAIVVARDFEQVIEDWRESLLTHLLSFLLLALTTVALLLLAARRQRSLNLAQQAVVERELELRTIIETEPECVKQVAADGTLLSMNRAGLNMVEAESLDQVLGKPVQQLVVPEQRDQFMALTRKVFAGESAVLIYEIEGLRGRRRWLETHAAPLRNAQGEIVSLLGVSRDFSERRQHQTLQEQTRRQLEAQLAEITLLQGELQEQAIRDPLTGLYNRRYLEETIHRELARARRENYPLALVMLDLDHFKSVNDSHGHAAGDAVIKALAVILGTSARDSDIVCRLGGEEFLVALPRMPAEQARQRAESWRRELAETVVRHDGASIVVTLSAGVAVFPAQGKNFDGLLASADKALYGSKKAGRNRVTLFDAG